MVNEAADQYFIGRAQLLSMLEALETLIGQNAKILIPSGTELINIVGDMAGSLTIIQKNFNKELLGSSKHNSRN